MNSDTQNQLESLEKALQDVKSSSKSNEVNIKVKSKGIYDRAGCTQLTSTYEEAIVKHEETIVKHQDYQIRQKYIKAVDRDIKSRKKVRGKFLTFYIWFMSIVTALIFFVIIDPVQLVRGQASIYANSLKLALVGVFFANLISIALLMVKYSFAPMDNMREAFEKLSKDHNNKSA